MSRKVNDNANKTRRNLILNSSAYIEWFDRLSNIAKSIFKWEGLPETVDSRFLEKLIFKYGKAGIYDNKDYGIVCTQISPANQLNIYDLPTLYLAHSRAWHEFVPFEKMVVIRNNINETPTIQAVERYAYKLANIERAIEKNIEAQGYSYLIKCDKNNEMTIRNLIAEHDTGAPIIFGSKGLNIEVDELNITPPLVADRLIDIYHSTYNECMRFFGVPSAGDDKKERVQSAEVDALNSEVSINVETQLKFRKEACEQLNKMFGTNATVKLYNEGNYNGENNSTINRTNTSS